MKIVLTFFADLDVNADQGNESTVRRCSCVRVNSRVYRYISSGAEREHFAYLHHF